VTTANSWRKGKSGTELERMHRVRLRSRGLEEKASAFPTPAGLSESGLLGTHETLGLQSIAATDRLGNGVDGGVG
jgi:hypothetical protein